MNKTVLNKNYYPLCYINNGLLAYKKEHFYFINLDTIEAKEICLLKNTDPRKWLCFCKLGERMAHITAYCGIAMEEGALVVFNRGIYHIDISQRKAIREHSFKLPDMRRPLNFYKIVGVKGFDDMILCPEYSNNVKRDAMSILKREHDGKWKAVYTFSKGTIRHIHAVVPDSYRNRVIILTGDDGDECAIWEAKNNFSKVKKIVGSSQRYRACLAKAYPEGILILTDSPYNQNYAYLLDDMSKSIKILAKIPGPVVSWGCYKDDVIFSTTVECSQRHIFKHFTYKRGEGIVDKYVRLYIGGINGFKEILKLPKDLYPMPIMGFGHIVLPNGEADGTLLYYPFAVRGGGKLKKLNLKEQ